MARRSPRVRRQARGAVLLILLAMLGLGAIFFVVSRIGSAAVRHERERITLSALAQAKEALIADAVSQTTITSAGYLPMPDLGFDFDGDAAEGIAAGNFAGNNQDLSLLGKVPWRTLGIAPPLDANEECLWYVVSGRLKRNPKTATFNWDTQGQIDVIDAEGRTVASNVAAMVVAPGLAKDGQNRALSDAAFAKCGGNYDARNYLDAYDSADAISDEVNYFAGSTNNRLAPNTNDKRFVLALNDHYNDRLSFITVDDIFRPLIRRSDFANQVRDLLNDPVFETYVRSIPITGPKGTSELHCSTGGSGSLVLNTKLENQTFCRNWAEMLLLTQLPAPSPITIDGALSGACARVLIFGGQKASGQVRITAADKSTVANYLEGGNRTSFATPIAAASDFAGASVFDGGKPSADVVKCLP